MTAVPQGAGRTYFRTWDGPRRTVAVLVSRQESGCFGMYLDSSLAARVAAAPGPAVLYLLAWGWASAYARICALGRANGGRAIVVVVGKSRMGLGVWIRDKGSVEGGVKRIVRYG
jgi:hypothetical protein